MEVVNETKILEVLSSMASKIENIEEQSKMNQKELAELKKITKHHTESLQELQLHKVPPDNREDILNTLKKIDERLSVIDRYNTQSNFIDGILFLYITLIGLYNYLKG